MGDYEEDEEDIVVHAGKDVLPPSASPASPATPPPPGPQRTPNRVHFDLSPEVMSMRDDGARSSASLELDDLEYLRPPSYQHRTPLLTDIEAPSVAVANRLGGAGAADTQDALEREMTRSKSGLKSAFMNMANSIIGAGIIGQPYAIRQAGLLAGVLLLVGLTAVVDWTICLIVINSKLSGTSSFQGTVEHCFGRTGLIAISVAQWVFAFGGMVAFGVIVGDTIPHVLMAVWPDLSNIPVLGLLTDRRVAIAVFCMGISYPLTLHRDIAKVRTLHTTQREDGGNVMSADRPCSWPGRARLHSSACR